MSMLAKEDFAKSKTNFVGNIQYDLLIKKIFKSGWYCYLPTCVTLGKFLNTLNLIFSFVKLEL